MSAELGLTWACQMIGALDSSADRSPSWPRTAASFFFLFPMIMDPPELPQEESDIVIPTHKTVLFREVEHALRWNATFQPDGDQGQERPVTSDLVNCDFDEDSRQLSSLRRV